MYTEALKREMKHKEKKMRLNNNKKHIYNNTDGINYSNKKSKEDVWTYDSKTLRVPLEQAIKKMGITLSQINEVQYNYTSISINNTVRELGIPNGGVVLIKLKSG